jgi:hypothetical protein
MVPAMPEQDDFQPIEIFRAGTHTPMAGASISFAAEDLAAIAGSYDPALHHAPVVVGHPRTDAPAFGWIDGLSVEGDRLVARATRVDPGFVELVRAGRYAKVSASFYRPDAPNNPVPGTWYLRHVGFLGAQPPAVKGLKPVAFGDEAGAVTFADWHVAGGLNVAARLFRRLRDYLIGSAGQERAEDVLPEWDVQRLAEIAIEAQPPATAPGFADPAPNDPTQEARMKADDIAARHAELERAAADLAAREASFAEREALRARQERARQVAEDAAFVDAIVGDGRLPVGLQPLATALFAAPADGVVEFSDGGETRKIAPREALRDLLSRLPRPVETRELANGAAAAVDFSDPLAIAGAITARIEAAARDGRSLSPADAMAELKETL